MSADASLSPLDSTSCFQRGRRSRRTLLAGAGGVTAGLLAGWNRIAAQIPVPTPVRGDCGGDPGVDLYLEFVLGNPVVQLTDLAVPNDWTLHPNTYAGVIFRQPPGWSGATLYAYQVSPQGLPLWTPQQEPMQAPVMVSGRSESNAGDAAFEFASGSLQGVQLSPLQVAIVAELGMVGDRARRTVLCAYEDQNPLGPAWLQASIIEVSTLLLTQGNAVAYSGLVPYTIVTYYSMYGPRDQFEPLMRQAFLHFMGQFYRGREISVTPTPTPEP